MVEGNFPEIFINKPAFGAFLLLPLLHNYFHYYLDDVKNDSHLNSER